MTAYTEAFWARVLALTRTLDGLSYYHLLDVDSTATVEDIAAIYYRRVRNLHPDRHAYETDPERRRALVRLYARFGEAFRVLRSPALRRAYDAELAAGRVRLSNEAQQQQRAALAAPDPKTHHAAKLLETARQQLRAGNVVGGLAQLQLATQFEPESAAIKREIEAWTPAEDADAAAEAPE